MATSAQAGGVDSPADGAQLDAVLYEFDRAWQSGSVPRIDEFLARVPPAGSLTRRRLLEELITIDLDYRWRNASGATHGHGPLQLEDYVARYPELGPRDGLTPELIGEEYWVRHRWGDHPGHADYAARFPRQQPQLKTVLALIDAELAEELAREPEPAQPVISPLVPAATSASAPRPAAPATTAGPVLATAAELREALIRHGLLTPTQFKEAKDQLSQFTDARGLASELLRRDWLTPFQVNQLLQGHGAELLLGPYVLLERLGRGGAGQVFKAQHQYMGRLVALKLIRKELLHDAEAVARFQREVRVISQLRHPNVVLAHDAGPLGGNYFLAMEYVEGVDLSRQVQQHGPLPPVVACEYVRQTALGLQHIHERGLVHRDIKPSNLLLYQAHGLQSAGLVKILDLGLARVSQSEAEGIGVVTAVGTLLVGTMDYMAPEQARDFHQADIRADIYSLGCAFYFLLTGHPPFPIGTFARKLLCHQKAEPRPVEEIRPDVPPWLPPILRRMMAKSPEDRFQTPAELAAVLATKLDPPAEIAVAIPVTATEVRRAPDALLPKMRPLLGNRRLLAVGGALLATLLIGGLLLALRGAGANSVSPSSLATTSVASSKTQGGSPQTGMQAMSPFEALATRGINPAQRPAGLKGLVSVLRDGIECIAVASDGRTLALGRSTGICRIYNTEDGKETTISGLVTGFPARAIAVAPNGQWGASSFGGVVDLWNHPTTTAMSRLNLLKLERKIAALAISPDSQILACGHGNRENPKDPGELRLYRLLQTRDEVWHPGCKGGVLALTFGSGVKVASDWGMVEQLLAVGGGDGLIGLGDVGKGRMWSGALTGHQGAVRGLSFAPDGRLASAGEDGMIRVWDLSTATQTQSLESRGNKFLSVAWSSDGKRLAGCTDSGEVKVWQMPGAQLAGTWSLPPPVTQVVFSPDSKFLLTCNGNGTVYVFRLSY
jgi:serine/threonine-protein kinase